MGLPKYTVFKLLKIVQVRYLTSNMLRFLLGKINFHILPLSNRKSNGHYLNLILQVEVETKPTFPGVYLFLYDIWPYFLSIASFAG